MRAEVRLRERGLGVAHARVPGTPAVVVGAPRDRVIVGRGAVVSLVVGRLVDRREHLHARIARAPVHDARRLPLTTGLAGGWKLYHSSERTHGSGRPVVEGSLPSSMSTVACGRAGRVIAEVAADHLAVPRPRVLGVGRGVDADVAPPAWMKRSNAVCCAALRMSLVVERKTTTSYWARLASVKIVRPRTRRP